MSANQSPGTRPSRSLPLPERRDERMLREHANARALDAGRSVQPASSSVPCVGVGLEFLEQQLGEGKILGTGGDVQRRHTVLAVALLHLRPVAQQQSHHLGASLANGNVQRRVSYERLPRMSASLVGTRGRARTGGVGHSGDLALVFARRELLQHHRHQFCGILAHRQMQRRRARPVALQQRRVMGQQQLASTRQTDGISQPASLRCPAAVRNSFTP